MLDRMNDETAIALLDKLSVDDAFRELFSNDPRAALASLGYAPAQDHTQANGIWDCWMVGQLASKEVIRASRDQLLRQVTSAKAGAHPITLEMRPAPSRRAA